MNCQVGDLALVIRSPYYRENVGKIVRCISLNTQFTDPKGGPVWNIDRELRWFKWSTMSDTTIRAAPDATLLPIRGEPDPEGEYTEHDEIATRSFARSSLLPTVVKHVYSK